MNAIKVVQEPAEAFEVAYEYKVQCQAVLASLKSLKAPFLKKRIFSTPINGFVFFEHEGHLACVPGDFIFNGTVEPGALEDPYLAEELDLSVKAKNQMCEAMIDWNSRPVFTISQSSFGADV